MLGFKNTHKIHLRVFLPAIADIAVPGVHCPFAHLKAGKLFFFFSLRELDGNIIIFHAEGMSTYFQKDPAQLFLSLLQSLKSHTYFNLE